MRLVVSLLIFSMLVLVASGWGDVLHYPEFVKHMEEIGNYNHDLDTDQEDRRYNNGKRSLFSSIIELRRSLDDAGLWIDDHDQERIRRGLKRNMMKRSFSTSQLRRQWNNPDTDAAPAFAYEDQAL
eukprot:TRINITY_DN22012_c0_g1_i1.p1 TRINITY_DN22012_c0_g1~~TRINITY_DN22012_c0_g1_i1.p1  ORF type:complete len:126 (+),score=33.44 TRINITY_DN22012_c0_g1_i1:3-380(+)